MRGEIGGQVTTLDIAENLLILTFEAHREVSLLYCGEHCSSRSSHLLWVSQRKKMTLSNYKQNHLKSLKFLSHILLVYFVCIKVSSSFYIHAFEE